jgi:hypothetical protein
MGTVIKPTTARLINRFKVDDQQRRIGGWEGIGNPRWVRALVLRNAHNADPRKAIAQVLTWYPGIELFPARCR